jgi:hypothetical protein
MKLMRIIFNYSGAASKKTQGSSITKSNYVGDVYCEQSLFIVRTKQTQVTNYIRTVLSY